VLPTITATVAHTLKLPYAAIDLWQAGELRPAAEHGHAPLDAAIESLTLPLVFQGEALEQLRVAGRGPGEPLSAADRQVLAHVARQAGAAVPPPAPCCAADEVDPPAAQAALAELRSEIRAAVTEIRRLVYDLRPPALDELGLAGALRALAAQLDQAGDSPVAVLVEAPDTLPPLPAAVEVAAYRIAQEALTNVARHAQARHCWVRVGQAGAHAGRWPMTARACRWRCRLG
jgi:hypothetical protein